MSIVLETPAGDRPAKSWPLAGLTAAAAAGTSGLYRQPQQDLVLPGIGAVNRYATFAALYHQQLWIHTAVNKLARGTSRLPLKTYAIDDLSGDRAELRMGDVADLIRKPYPGGSARTLIEAVVGSCAIYSSALCVKFREQGPGSRPTELWPVPWHRIQVIEGRDRPIDGYVFIGERGRRVLIPEDVVHFTWWAPDQPYGVSPLEALARTLAAEDAAQRYAVSNFANAARPASVIQAQEGSKRNLNKAQRDELRGEINAAYAGPDNAFKVAILEAGLEWKPIAWNAQEAELIQGRKLNREEVAAAYDIPPPIIQILDRATFSNIDEQHRMWYQDTLAPWLSMVTDTLQAQLLDPEPAFASTFFEFDLNEVLKSDVDKRSTAYLRFMQAGVYTPNELRKLENLGRIDHPAADAIWVQVNMQPVGEGFDPQAPTPQQALAASLMDAMLAKEADGPALDEFLKRHEGELAEAGWQRVTD